MTAAGWMRRWRGGRGAEGHASAPVLAASALDREAAREEQTGLNEILRKIIEESREWLVLN